MDQIEKFLCYTKINMTSFINSHKGFFIHRLTQKDKQVSSYFKLCNEFHFFESFSWTSLFGRDEKKTRFASTHLFMCLQDPEFDLERGLEVFKTRVIHIEKVDEDSELNLWHFELFSGVLKSFKYLNTLSSPPAISTSQIDSKNENIYHELHGKKRG